MMARPGFVGGDEWTNQDLRLFHGTVSVHWKNPLTDPFRIEASRKSIDFGRGFYTTTNYPQAYSWACQVSERYGGEPLVLGFEVSREELACLSSMWFVRGGENAEDFWTFVRNCRFRHDHARLKGNWYDLIVGPVVKNQRLRTLHCGLDQVSFHTVTAIELINQTERFLI